MSPNTHEQDLVRLHERWMNGTDNRFLNLEKKIDKIPWILLLAMINIFISFGIVVLEFLLKGGAHAHVIAG